MSPAQNEKNPPAIEASPRQHAWLITLLYLILASLWIVFSGSLMDLLPITAHARADLEIYKGLLYVLLTSALLYALLHKWLPALSAAPSSGEVVKNTPARKPPKALGCRSRLCAGCRERGYWTHFLRLPHKTGI